MNKSVTTLLTACAMRVRPSHEAPMTSQLLFGEIAEIQSVNKKGWAKIKTMYDRHRGWTLLSQLVDATCPREHKSRAQKPSICLDLVAPIFGDGHSTLISMGSELTKYDGMTCRTAGHTFRFSGTAVQYKSLDVNGELIKKIARKLINTPYLAGGRSPLGVDAAGYVQLVYKCCGLKLPRTLRKQIERGETVDFIEYCQPGDLVFCSDTQGQLSHVGIALPDLKIIHADGRVRIDRLDHHGIFDVEQKTYTHKLKIIKRHF